MITRRGSGCWAMCSSMWALSASIQWRSSITSTTGPAAAAAAMAGTTSRAGSPPGGQSWLTTSKARPSEPGWAAAIVDVTPLGRRAMNSRINRVLPMPASPETSTSSGPSQATTSAASTRPVSRASAAARPTIVDDRPLRPESIASTIPPVRSGDAVSTVGLDRHELGVVGPDHSENGARRRRCRGLVAANQPLPGGCIAEADLAIGAERVGELEVVEHEPSVRL